MLIRNHASMTSYYHVLKFPCVTAKPISLQAFNNNHGNRDGKSCNALDIVKLTKCPSLALVLWLLDQNVKTRPVKNKTGRWRMFDTAQLPWIPKSVELLAQGSEIIAEVTSNAEVTQHMSPYNVCYLLLNLPYHSVNTDFATMLVPDLIQSHIFIIEN